MDYNDMRTVAADLVNDFGNGGQVTFHRKNVIFYNSVDDVEDLGPEIVVAVDCVQTPRSVSDVTTPYDDLTRNRFLKVTVPAVGLGVFRPAPGDRIAIPGDATRYTVTDVKPVQPDGIPIFYTMYAEKGATT